uniref:Uncharacterized protein n=1 Tax=Rhizophora mucronata TaxID=61149 RepID=A0A2P2QTW4_RHIMU
MCCSKIVGSLLLINLREFTVRLCWKRPVLFLLTPLNQLNSVMGLKQVCQSSILPTDLIVTQVV